MKLAGLLKEIEPKTKGLSGTNPNDYETNNEKNFAAHHAGDMYMGYMGAPSDKDTVDFDDGDVEHKPKSYNPKDDKVKKGYEPINSPHINEMNLAKIIKELENPCWKGYEMIGMKEKDGKEVPNCVPVSEDKGPCWKGYQQVGMKEKDGRQVPNCVPINEDIDSDDDVNYGLVEPEEYDVEDEDMEDFIAFMRGYDTTLNEGCQCLREAEYQGREVKLGKPMAGDVKKFKVYVKNPSGNVVKVNFGHGGTSAASKGEKTMRIRKSNPDARRSFRARHNCDEPGPRHKARYWSCRKW
jgi:hypothetical protein